VLLSGPIRLEGRRKKFEITQFFFNLKIFVQKKSKMLGFLLGPISLATHRKSLNFTMFLKFSRKNWQRTPKTKKCELRKNKK